MAINSSSKKAGRSNGLVIAFAVAALAVVGAAFYGRTGGETPATAVQEGIVDARGRTINVQGPVSRIAIDDSRYLVALALIHPEPVKLLAAWPKDVNRLGNETYAQILEKSPELENLPRIASSAAAFDMESLLAAKPDLALLSLESGVTDAQISQIEAAGIPVVVVDFFVKPFENLEKSLTLLGKLTGREEQAKAFLDFRAQRMKLISDKVAKLPTENRPTVFVEAHAGMSAECCNSPGRGNIGDYINFVGGHNIGSDVIEQSFGKMNLEYVISRDPTVYIATGGSHLAKVGGLVMGAGYDEETARQSLVKMAARKGLSGLTAVKEGRAYGFSHQLINSPIDIVAIEAFAKWIQPELFADTDPKATLDAINSQFLSVPYEGVYWVDIK